MSLYEVLGVGEGATLAEIKAAHREAVKAHHPDAGGDPERFIRAQRAYLVLSDPERRALYDRTGAEEDGGADDQNAYAALATLFLQIVDGNGDLRRLDVVGVVRGRLQEQETAHQASRRGLEARIARVRLLKERLHGDGAEDDALLGALDERVALLEGSRTREADQLRTLARALELLSRYSYDQDPSSPEEAAIWSALRSGTSER